MKEVAVRIIPGRPGRQNHTILGVKIGNLGVDISTDDLLTCDISGAIISDKSEPDRIVVKHYNSTVKNKFEAEQLLDLAVAFYNFYNPKTAIGDPIVAEFRRL